MLQGLLCVSVCVCGEGMSFSCMLFAASCQSVPGIPSESENKEEETYHVNIDHISTLADVSVKLALTRSLKMTLVAFEVWEK